MSPRAAGGRRPVRARQPRGREVAGEEYVVEVGAYAHGGHCVARLADDAPGLAGTVVFVRHTLPGEVVTVRLTEGTAGERFLRGDAVEVHQPSPARTEPPCPVAVPGGCGGCDLQHVRLSFQRELKAGVVAEQLRRLAKVDVEVEVEALPGAQDGLRYRRRMRFVSAAGGRQGFRAHRSRRVVGVEDCLLQAPDAVVVVEGEPVGPPVTEVVRGRRFEVAADGFWQVHSGAPEALVEAVLTAAGVEAGDSVLDLYSGVGLFAAFLADEAGATGSVRAVESDRVAVGHAQSNLTAYPWVEVVAAPVNRALARGVGPADVVVLDPPREGAKRAVVEAVVALAPRRVVHVGCDPASFARDVALFAEHGYALSSLRVLDLFPMTHHVECIGVLEPK